MDFNLSTRRIEWRQRLTSFLDEQVRPRADLYQEQLGTVAEERWRSTPVMAELKCLARDAGLWNLFLPPSVEHDTPEYRGAGLSTLSTRCLPKKWESSLSHPKCSTALRPTPATWRCCIAIAARSRSGAGSDH